MLILDGIDDQILEENFDVMRQEIMKDYPNYNAIKELMLTTVNERAKLMESITTSRIITDFAYLRIPTLVSQISNLILLVMLLVY